MCKREKVTHLITQLSDKVESLIVENPSTLKRNVASLLASSSSSAPSSQPSTSASSGACCGCGSTCLCACIIIKNSFYNLRWIMSFGHISRNNTLAYTFGAPTWTIINKFWRTITRLPPTHLVIPCHLLLLPAACWVRCLNLGETKAQS